jgi:hypothetical protein
MNAAGKTALMMRDTAEWQEGRMASFSAQKIEHLHSIRSL